MLEPKIFDIHCHLNLPDFPDWSVVLDNTLKNGCWIINIGADLESSKLAVEIAKTQKSGVWASVGFHPTDSLDLTDENWEEVKNLAKDTKVVAIGECGLEYYSRSNEEISEVKKEEQKITFHKHIKLALDLNKPLMIHCRPSFGSQDAYVDAVNILSEYKKEVGNKLRGNFHFFAGNWETAQKCLDLGFTLSFTGVITFTHQYDDVIKKIPLDMIMAETDAPFVAPDPYRGKRCEPIYVAEVVKKMAELRALSFEEMTQITVKNGRKLFGV